jgi:superfamily II DNA or RNA helicase
VEHPVPLDDLLQVSKEVAAALEDYRHCEYQAAVAASIVSRAAKHTVAVSPTGSGKTWI